ncbi:MAG: YdiY family protein [Planctomycetota bacterium]
MSARRALFVGLVLFVVLGSTPIARVFARDAAAEPAAAPAPADEVVLKDGTRILGKITDLGGGVLKISTAAASSGALEVKFSEVASIRSQNAHTLVLTDGNKLVGKPGLNATGQWFVETTDAGTVAIADPSKISQINPPEVKPVVQKFNANLNGRVTDGNTRVKSTNAWAEYEQRTQSTRLTGRGDWNYTEDDGELSARNAKGSMKYDVFLTRRLFTYANAQFEGDDFADLNLRSTLGAGLGYQFVDGKRDNKNWAFYEEAGISFVDEDLDVGSDTRYAAARVAGKLNWDIIEKRLAFFHFHEILPGLEDKDDVNANTQTGVRIAINANLYANFQVNYKWDNTPAPGINRGDTEYLWGIGCAFEF